MRNVHTLKDISSDHRLGSAREMELEEMLRNSIQSISELTNEYKDMQGVYSSYSKKNDQDKAKLHRNLEQAETNNRKLSDRIHQLIDEISQLRSEMDSLNFQITHKDISLAESKDKLATKSKEIKALQSKLKTLEKNHSLAQMNLSEMEYLRLELKRARDDLSSKKYELECMEKGIESSNNIFKREIDALSSGRLKLIEANSRLQEIISKKDDEIADLSNPPPPPMNDSSQKLPGWLSDDLRPLVYKLGLEDKVIKLGKEYDKEDILEALQELLSRNEMVSRSQTDILPNQSIHSRPAHSEKSILREGVAKQSGGAEVVPSPQVMPLAGPSRTTPVVKSSLMPYAILALLLIVVIWFVVRKWWNPWKKSNTEYSPNQNYFLSSPDISDAGLYDRRPEV
ncbi:unnamed protein product [Rhizophagus irregularis]|nr:unnamed protein product [Rhizophagus irregularis]